MDRKQLAIMIGVTVVLSLVLAWVIEQAQVRRFMTEFETWYEGRFSDKSDTS
jgi:hypothetical protein